MGYQLALGSKPTISGCIYYFRKLPNVHIHSPSRTHTHIISPTVAHIRTFYTRTLLTSSVHTPAIIPPLFLITHSVYIYWFFMFSDRKIWNETTLLIIFLSFDYFSYHFLTFIILFLFFLSFFIFQSMIGFTSFHIYRKNSFVHIFREL